MNLDLAKSTQLLEEAGFAVENSEMPLATIARQYKVPPQHIYETIKPAMIIADPKPPDSSSLPESPPPGTGNLTLADFCEQYRLNVKRVVGELKKQGLASSEERTLKDIAAQNETSPLDLYERIKGIAQN